jgi:phage gp29-like protein
MLNIVLDKMNNEFTSNKFYSELKKVYGDAYNTRIVTSFLNTNCVHTNNSNRQWRKKETKIQSNDLVYISNAINLLKANGYKVQKRTIVWEDV